MTFPLSNDDQAAAEFLRSELRRIDAENYPKRQEGEFTITEYADANDINTKTASYRLESLKKAGILQRPPKRVIDGKLQIVYKRVLSKPE